MLEEFFLGILGGTLTGITPALHVNTLAGLLRSISKPDFNFMFLIYIMGLTHTFLDAIPSAFLGIPEEETSLSVLPAHRLVHQGKGLEVINIAITASTLALLFAIPLLPIYLKLAPLYRPEIGRVFVLIMAMFLILTERGIKKLHALLIFMLSGALGLIIDVLPLKDPYFHVFVGLFGVPALITGMENRKFEVGESEIEMSGKRILKFSFLGTFLGALASLIPTFTSSQAALVGSFLSKDERSFLTVAFSVNTANYLFSTGNFYLTGRARNGILVIFRESYPILGEKEFLILIFGSFCAAALINLYGLELGRAIGKGLMRLDYRKLNTSILAVILMLSFYLDGIFGVLTLIAAASIGYAAIELGVKRTNCMGVLMLRILIK